MQARVEAYIVEQHVLERSLRVLAEETDRSSSAVRNVTDRHAVRRRPAGARRLAEGPAPVQ